MLEQSLTAIIDRLQKLRGPEADWRKQTSCVLDYVKHIDNNATRLERLIAIGECHLADRHCPAIMTYCTTLDSVLVWIANRERDGVEKSHVRYFHTKLPQLIHHQWETDNSTVVVG